MAPPGTGEPPKREAKLSGPAGACAGAGARLLSIGVQAVVMAAAFALFLLFAAASAVLLLHLVVAARAFRNHPHGASRYRVPTASAASPSPPQQHRRPGLSSAELCLLPCYVPSPCDDPSSSSSPQLCSVCLEAALAGERWRALPACGHAFHAACVDRWLVKSPACPMCRADVAVSVS